MIDLPTSSGRISAAFPSRARLREARGEDDSSFQAAPKMFPCRSRERLVCALENPLSSDVSPRSCSHLSEHYQTLLFQLVEVVPCCPFGNQHAVDYQDSWCHSMGLEDRHRLPALNEKSVVLS